ncbi:522_t:CDS:2, partial [Paraglomus occultum]
QNPGLFIDYTGQMIKNMYRLMRNAGDGIEPPKKILNAMMVLKSGDSRLEAEAPPVLVAEFITADLSADHLATCLQKLRKDDYDIFHSNVVPYKQTVQEES